MRIASTEASRHPTGEKARVPPWRWVNFAVIPFMLAMSAALAVSAYIRSRTISTSVYNPKVTVSPMRQLMGLSDMPNRPAPGFTLVDQAGDNVSLGQFRGKAVLLAFLDSRCTTVCPVLAQEFLLAQKDLGPASAKVAFIAVNVNPLAASVADVAAFDRLHGLDQMRNWYFLTGPGSELLRIANEYGIAVIVPKNGNPNQIEHADTLYFISATGRERYLASPVVDRTKSGAGYLPQPALVQWGGGIATYLTRIA